MLVGLSMLCAVWCGAELSCQNPVSGSYALHASRFIYPSVGFSVGINYLLMWLVSFPSELVSCSLKISYCSSSNNQAVWVAIFFVFFMLLNLFGARGFAETEFACPFSRLYHYSSLSSSVSSSSMVGDQSPLVTSAQSTGRTRTLLPPCVQEPV